MPPNITLVAVGAPSDSEQLMKVRADAMLHRYGTFFDEMKIPDRGRYCGMAVKDIVRFDAKHPSPLQYLINQSCHPGTSEKRFRAFRDNPEYCWLAMRVYLSTRDDQIKDPLNCSAQSVNLYLARRRFEKENHIPIR